MINAQLPLAPGRRVAYHHKTNNFTPEGGKEEGWILAQITECIGGDKTKFVASLGCLFTPMSLIAIAHSRYRVQDVDYDPASSMEQGCVGGSSVVRPRS